MVSGAPTAIQIEDAHTTNALEVPQNNTELDTTLKGTTAAAQIDTVTSNASAAINYLEQTQVDDASLRSNSDPSEQTPPTSNSTLLQADPNEKNKKSTGTKSIANNQQTAKPQPHIIRHHTMPHAQSLQLISSSTTPRTKTNITQACITPTIRCNQSTSLANVSMNSPKTIVSMGLTTNNAHVLLPTVNCSSNGGEGGENTEGGKRNKINAIN